MEIKVFDLVIYKSMTYSVRYIEGDNVYLSRVFRNGNLATTVIKVDKSKLSENGE